MGDHIMESVRKECDVSIYYLCGEMEGDNIDDDTAMTGNNRLFHALIPIMYRNVYLPIRTTVEENFGIEIEQ
jgi:hypothetical protein